MGMQKNSHNIYFRKDSLTNIDLNPKEVSSVYSNRYYATSSFSIVLKDHYFILPATFTT